jgi:ribosomal-protein-alanine N-acetyltransferase
MLHINLSPFPDLKTPRLTLRQLRHEDADEIFILRSDPSVNEFLNRKKAQTIEDAEEHIAKINKGISNNESVMWAITLADDTKLIGTICLWNIIKEKDFAELGYELLPQYQGKGLMQEALSKVLEYGFDHLQLKTVEAWLSAKNIRSIKLLEKNNFKRDLDTENKMDKKDEDDLIVYSLTKEA